MRATRLVLAGLAALAVANSLLAQPATPGPQGKGRGSEPAATQGVSGRSADFRARIPSSDARYLADWVADSRDNNGSAFIVVDKKNATLYVFDPQARLRGSSPVLLGSAIGDDSVPGIGERPLSQVAPQERTTPAGRFLAERGHNAHGADVVWVDYEAAVSMHRVLTSNPAERRLERLATPTVEDNRISWGCINVPVTFFESMIRPIFAKRRAFIYVLPDLKSVQQVFGSYGMAVRPKALEGQTISFAPR